MAVSTDIQQKANDIRTKVYGKDVRESLASGLESMSSDINQFEEDVNTDNENFKTDITAEEAQHTQAEQARVTAETARAQAETTRQANEDNRKTTEASRVTAETARETAFAGMTHVDANLELSSARQGKDSLLANLQDKDNQIANVNSQLADIANKLTFLDKLRLKIVYNASGSNNTIHVNAVAGSNNLTVNLQTGDNSDFVVGNGINIVGAKSDGSNLITKITAINNNNITVQNNIEKDLTATICYHDDTKALQNALADGIDIVLNGIYNVSGTLVVDISKQSFIGVNNSIIITRIDDGSPTINIDNSDTVYNTQFLTANNCITGFKIKGTTTYQNTIGIRLKSTNSDGSLVNFSINNVAISYCSVGLQLSTRCFCDVFNTIIISYCDKCLSFDSNNNLNTLGERYTFIGCMFANSNVALDNIWNEFHFIGCSFDYNIFILDLQGGVVNMSNCHFEGCPGTSDKTTIHITKSINNTGNILRIKNSYINHCGYENNNLIYFDGNTQYGTSMYALIKDCTFSNMSTLSNYLASGNGLFRIKGIRYNENMPSEIIYPSKLNNILIDDFSQGTIIFDDYISSAGITINKNIANKTLDITINDQSNAQLTLLLPPVETLLLNFKIKIQNGSSDIIKVYNKYAKVKYDKSNIQYLTADTALPQFTFSDSNFHIFHSEFTNHQYVGCYALANQVNLIPCNVNKRAIVFDFSGVLNGKTVSIVDIEAYEI